MHCIYTTYILCICVYTYIYIHFIHYIDTIYCIYTLYVYIYTPYSILIHSAYTMYTVKNIYAIYIYIWYPPHGSTIFVCFRAPPHENCRSLRGGASRWTFLWLGELHPGPIEFNRPRLSSIGGRIED